jgi:curved DNA-binding protein CbpA
MEARDDPYDLLGVSRDASAQEIRSAYRKLALKHHPDKQRTEEDRQRSTKLFAKISNAYEILSDSEQRRQYDLGQQQPTFESSDFFTPFHSHFHDPFSVFESVFREEFGRPSYNGFASREPFMNDPFMNSPFGSIFGQNDMMSPFGSMMGGSLFGDPFGRRVNSRRETRDPFQDMFSSLRNMQPDQGNNGSFYSYTSTSTTSSRGGETVTTQTTTKLINGQRQTVTERIVRKPDGTVERQILDNDNPTELLEDQPERSQQHNRLPWRKSNSSTSSKRKRSDPPSDRT